MFSFTHSRQGVWSSSSSLQPAGWTGLSDTDWLAIKCFMAWYELAPWSSVSQPQSFIYPLHHTVSLGSPRQRKGIYHMTQTPDGRQHLLVRISWAPQYRTIRLEVGVTILFTWHFSPCNFPLFPSTPPPVTGLWVLQPFVPTPAAMPLSLKALFPSLPFYKRQAAARGRL